MVRVVVFRRETCLIPGCPAGIVTAKHYARYHGIRVTDYCNSVEAVAGRYYYCKEPGDVHRGVRASSTHEFMIHLLDMHQELFLRDEQAVVTESPEKESAEVEREVDPERSLGNAVVSVIKEVFDHLSVQRHNAEAEAERLRIEVDALREKLRSVTESNVKLELANAELTDKNFEKAQKIDNLINENSRLVKDNREMNNEMLRVRNGAKLASEFRAAHGELQGRRS